MKPGGVESKKAIVQDVAQCLNRSEEIISRSGGSKCGCFKDMAYMGGAAYQWVSDDHDFVVPYKRGVKCRQIS